MACKKRECLKKLNALGEDGKNILKTILFYSNKPLIEGIVHLAIAAHYKELIIVFRLKPTSKISGQTGQQT